MDLISRIYTFDGHQVTRFVNRVWLNGDLQDILEYMNLLENFAASVSPQNIIMCKWQSRLKIFM